MPWERLFHIIGDTETPLATSAQTPFSRFLVTGAGDLQPANERPLRLLLAIANPQGLPSGLGAIDVMLSEREQRSSCATVFEFMARAKAVHLDHKVIMAVRPASLEADGPFSEQDFHLLGVQRMARQKVRHFLQSEAKEHPWAESLLNQIDQSGYFDLIAVPWFMVMLVERARNGFCPRSRTEVITTIVDDAIDHVVRDIASWRAPEGALLPADRGQPRAQESGEPGTRRPASRHAPGC